MKKYRLLMAALDEAGITANIIRIASKWYEVHVNYEVVKRYRQRRSANKYISRLHKEHCYADN